MPPHFGAFQKKSAAVFFWVAALFILQGVASPRVDASPAKDEDFGIWNVYDVEKKINAQWKMKVGEELRYRNHNGLYYAETHVGADYKPFKYLAGGAEFQEIRASRTIKKHEKWFWEEVPRIYLTPQFSYKGFSLEDRNMLEFRIRQDSRFSLRYRNLATLTAPWKWTRFEFQPYTANETFWDTQRNGFIEDRYYAGFKVHVWGPVSGSIYYLRHSTKNAIAKWTSLNILGTSLKLSF